MTAPTSTPKAAQLPLGGLAEACKMFNLESDRDTFTGLLFEGTAWLAMTGRPIEVMHQLYAARPSLTRP